MDVLVSLACTQRKAPRTTTCRYISPDFLRLFCSVKTMSEQSRGGRKSVCKRSKAWEAAPTPQFPSLASTFGATPIFIVCRQPIRPPFVVSPSSTHPVFRMFDTAIHHAHFSAAPRHLAGNSSGIKRSFFVLHQAIQPMRERAGKFRHKVQPFFFIFLDSSYRKFAVTIVCR